MSSATCLSTPSGQLVRVATRERKLSEKSNSPFIARAVTAATCSPTPASLAISSMHSIWIVVESISMRTTPG